MLPGRDHPKPPGKRPTRTSRPTSPASETQEQLQQGMDGLRVTFQETIANTHPT